MLKIFVILMFVLALTSTVYILIQAKKNTKEWNEFMKKMNDEKKA